MLIRNVGKHFAFRQFTKILVCAKSTDMLLLDAIDDDLFQWANKNMSSNNNNTVARPDGCRNRHNKQNNSITRAPVKFLLYSTLRVCLQFMDRVAVGSRLLTKKSRRIKNKKQNPCICSDGFVAHIAVAHLRDNNVIVRSVVEKQFKTIMNVCANPCAPSAPLLPSPTTTAHSLNENYEWNFHLVLAFHAINSRYLVLIFVVATRKRAPQSTATSRTQNVHRRWHEWMKSRCYTFIYEHRAPRGLHGNFYGKKTLRLCLPFSLIRDV